jgi:heat shock protein HtpX
MRQSRSLAARAVMALGLMLGFYGLAIGISAALLWIPYAEYEYLGRVHFKLLFLCWAAAAVVLWAIAPRFDRFQPPGPALTRDNAPGLFHLIDDVARSTSQPSPSEVYLLNDVNAWVTQRGGIMGVGSRRVMGVGLPLLAHLSSAELKAVIAHEFGHYVSGDVGLGPWIHKTRTAIGRAVDATRNTVLETPFRLYAGLFLRTTLAVSREQEFVADRTAARVAGAGPVMSALRRVGTLAPAYAAYLKSEVMPVLRSGFLPPIAAGFDSYIGHPPTAAFFDKLMAEQPAMPDNGQFETHPPLADRIKALGELRPHVAAPDRHSASPVLSDVDAHAQSLLGHALGDDVLAGLRRIQWEDVGRVVYEQRWHELARTWAWWFDALTLDQLPAGEAWFSAMGAQLVGNDEAGVDDPERIARAAQLLEAGVGSTLARLGWTVETRPGLPIELVKGHERLEPRAVIAGRLTNQLTWERWAATCERLELTGILLAYTSEQPQRADDMAG